MHGAGWARPGDIEGCSYRIGCARSAGQPTAPLGDGCEQLLLVEPLMGEAIPVGGRHAVGDHQSGKRSSVACAAPLTAHAAPGPRVAIAMAGRPTSTP